MNKRRRFIKGVTVTGAASAIWQKPVIESAILPGHSMTTTFEYFSEDLAVSQLDSSPWYERALDSAVPRAIAQEEMPEPAALCAMVNGNTAMISGRNDNNELQFGGNVPTNGTGVELSMQAQGPECDFDEDQGRPTASIIGYTYGDPTITISLEGGQGTQQFTIPLAPCNFSALEECSE